MSKTLNYTIMMQDALRTLVKNVLKKIEIEGLPGDHHFYITFDTKHPTVQLADWLKEKHPDEITIVIQNWFDGLKVAEDNFSIILNFGDQLEEMTIPFQSIISFVDPSVEFGLKFENIKNEEQIETTTEAEMVTIENNDKKDAEIVSLDSFRK
tara:strand:- start:158 stop:616 length:459 start_codon:yes stop_codon:yes gene_type:complete